LTSQGVITYISEIILSDLMVTENVAFGLPREHFLQIYKAIARAIL